MDPSMIFCKINIISQSSQNLEKKIVDIESTTKKYLEILLTIRGLKPPPTTQSTLEEETLEEGVKIGKVEGCEYRIGEEEIVTWLSLYGEVVSEVEEDFYVIKESSEELFIINQDRPRDGL